MTARALEPGYFDALYARDIDPWGFETSVYEAAKYTATLAALPRLRYRNAVEIGCSIGVLTAQLAARCDALLGVDVAAAALDHAARRCAAFPHVAFARSTLPDVPPAGIFDLIILSEVLYYFDIEGIARLKASLRQMAAPGADLILVHWLGPTPDYPMTGDAAVGAFEALFDARVMRRERTADYRLDVLRASPASGSAARHA